MSLSLMAVGAQLCEGGSLVSERIDHDTNRCMLVGNTPLSVQNASILIIKEMKINILLRVKAARPGGLVIRVHGSWFYIPVFLFGKR